MNTAEEPRLLHEFFARSVALHGDHVAVDTPPGRGRPARATVTYSELDKLANGVARRLSAVVTDECVVAVLLPRASHHLYAAQLGVLSAGGAYVGMDSSFPDDRLRFVMEDCGAGALLTDAAGIDRARRMGLSLTEMIDVHEIEPSAKCVDEPEWLTPRSLAYVIYTSGTTGRPKGTLIEHGSVANLVADDLAVFGLGTHDRVLHSSSPAYDSSVEETWLAFAAASTLVVADDDAVRLGPDLVHWLARERINVLAPTPTLLRTTGCDDPQSALPDLRVVYTGGEAIPQDVVDRWAPGRRLENGYGPTECAVVCLRGTLNAAKPVTIGRPVRNAKAWVVDDALRAVPDGVEGELCIGGIGLARGYLNRPQLTAQHFPEHPDFGRIYRTGDRVRREAGGEYTYLGRIDTQVKVRGYRVELEAVETRLSECAGVRAAACAVQDESGASVLVAHIVPEDAAVPPSFAAVADELRAAVPDYMVPARFAVLDRLPASVSGKLDRAALAQVRAPDRDQTEGVAPRNPIESRISETVAAVLRLGAAAPVEHDFFLDLGGDSLRAAELVSALRRHPETAALAVRDVYELRTVAGLAERARTSSTATTDPAARRGVERVSPLRASLFHAAWLCSGLLFGAAVLYVFAFLVLPWLLRLLDVTQFLLLLPVISLALLVVYAPLAVGFTALCKRVLIGRYTPLRAPFWGSFHVRNWVMQRVAAVIPWGLLRDTVFLNAALRTLGARIGKRVHIHRGVDLRGGGWDLLDIGDDVTVSQDAALRLVDLEDGEFVVGPVTLGAGSTVDIRASISGHASMGDRSYIAPLSWLPAGAHVPDGEAFDGVPARPAGVAPPDPDTPQDALRFSPVVHGALTIATRAGSGLALAYLSFAIPALLCCLAWDVDSDAVLTWLFSPTFGPRGLISFVTLTVGAALISTPLAALGMRLLGRVPDGTIPRFGLGYLRVLAKTDTVTAAGELLSGTLFWPIWLRWAGMRIGDDCEVSTIVDTLPESVSIGNGTFLADGLYVGGPRLHRGGVTIASSRFGSRNFAGNHAVVPAGTALPDDILLGVCTVADEQRMREGSDWFGHPPLELPRREVLDMDRTLTHDPGAYRYARRLFWESLRFALPAIPAIVMIAWFKGVVAAEGALSTRLLHVIGVPAVTVAVAVFMCLLVLVAKWVLLGRVRPGKHGLWSSWCSRWDFLYVVWRSFARPFLAPLSGTLFAAPYLRAMGARIGRRVMLGGGFAQLVDPDMIRIDDEATVACLFQAHSFEDRVLKIDRVTIGRRSALDTDCLLLYGADIGDAARVRPHSVVMKGEHLQTGRTYSGVPVNEAH